MKKKSLLFILVVLVSLTPSVLKAQLGVNTDGSSPHTSAMLDIKASNKGLLIPRLTSSQRNTLAATATAGLMVYDTDLNKFYYYNGTAWQIGTTGEIWKTDGGNVSLEDINDFVGIGTTSPNRKLEVRGSWLTARLSTTSSGPFLEFVGSATTDWSVGSWGNAFWFSSSDDDFQNRNDNYTFTKTSFYPYVSNSISLGASSNRWSNIMSIDGDFSGSVGVGTTNPAKVLEVYSGISVPARFTSATSGSRIEFSSSSATDWAVGTWANTFRFLSSVDNFANSTDEYYMSTFEFSPFSDNVRTLGSSSKKWSNVMGVLGTYTGSVSVGTATHLGSLHVHDGVNQNATIYITPQNTASGDSSTVFFAEDHDATYGMYWLYDGLGNDMELWGRTGGSDYGPHVMVSRENGNMAIGSTYANGYKLSVSGKIICTELRVNLVADWPDYVFKKDYKLMSIEVLGDFINKNGHLPNIPPASEIEKSGMDVGEMQKKMMEKIEELSLYIIQQQKQIRELQEQINKQGN